MNSLCISKDVLAEVESVRSRFRRFAPWPHWVVDDFLDMKSYSSMQEHLSLHSHEFRVLDGDENKVHYCLLTESTVAQFFYSLDFYHFVRNLCGKDIDLNDKSMIQLRLANEEVPAFPRHHDFTPLGRSLVVIFYVSPNWSPECKGRLFLHRSSTAPVNSAVVVEPIANRLIAFYSDKKNWHSVEQVSR